MRGKESILEIVAWFLAFSFGGAFFGSTKADIVEKNYGEVYTLEYTTTSYGADFFTFAFERMATQVCPEGYKVLDKTNQPGDKKSTKTRWLISCDDSDLSN